MQVSVGVELLGNCLGFRKSIFFFFVRPQDNVLPIAVMIPSRRFVARL